MEKCVTLASEIRAFGVGLHGGQMAEVALIPRDKAGITIVRTDVPDGRFELRPEIVKHSPLCTLLENEHGVTLGTVEHLLSALHGLRVDALDIQVSGPEVPILDGSAAPWVELIDEAGRRDIDVEREWLEVKHPVVVDSEGRVLAASPDPRKGLRIECTVDFPHPLIGRQVWKGLVDEETYRQYIASARTFVLERDIAAAKEAGLAQGGSLDNAVVFGDVDGVLNEGGLRFPDEPVRHKVLDAVGDLFLAGRCVSGVFHLTLPGHIANNMLLRKICAAE